MDIYYSYILRREIKRVLVFTSEKRTLIILGDTRQYTTRCTIDFRHTSKKRDQTFSTASSRITPLDALQESEEKLLSKSHILHKLQNKKNLFKIINVDGIVHVCITNRNKNMEMKNIIFNKN